MNLNITFALPRVPIWNGPKICQTSEKEDTSSLFVEVSGEGTALFWFAWSGISWLTPVRASTKKDSDRFNSKRNLFMLIVHLYQIIREHNVYHTWFVFIPYLRRPRSTDRTITWNVISNWPQYDQGLFELTSARLASSFCQGFLHFTILIHAVSPLNPHLLHLYISLGSMHKVQSRQSKFKNPHLQWAVTLEITHLPHQRRHINSPTISLTWRPHMNMAQIGVLLTPRSVEVQCHKADGNQGKRQIQSLPHMARKLISDLPTII